MTQYKYTGRAYRQALDDAAPWLVSFVAPAEELAQWAGVPRRSEQNKGGFQRLEDQSRVDQAREYFQQPANQSPTSLILGLHGKLTSSIFAELSFLPEDGDTGGSLPCILTISYAQPTAEEAREVVTKLLQARLIEGILESDGLSSDSQQLDADDDSPVLSSVEPDDDLLSELTDDETRDQDALDLALDDEEDAPEDEELELGQSVLSDMLRYMQDEDWLKNPTNAEAIIDLAKPATIIDGQHRLMGADATERKIPFSIVALNDCSWAEQVFQFTVVNYTAKGIPDQFITANAALSLTKPELDMLKTRLVQANVKIKEYDLMRVVNFDPRSPFTNLINLTEKRDPNLIGYKTMVQVAAQWFDAKHQVFNTLLPRLYPEIKGKGQKRKRIERWRESDWGEFFLAFWQEMHKYFADEASHEHGKKLWDVGHSQLTVAVVLLELQRAFLDNLNAQDEEFFDVESGEHLAVLTDKVAQRARKFVKFFPAAFFAKKWGITSLNTGSGRRDLESCIREMVNAKGSYLFNQDRLITGG